LGDDTDTTDSSTKNTLKETLPDTSKIGGIPKPVFYIGISVFGLAVTALIIGGIIKHSKSK